MIALEPDFGQVAELAIFGDVARGQMAVVIKDRLFFGESVIETFGCAGLEEKIFVNEFHGNSYQLVTKSL
jgi:hypothetical protein